MFDKFSNSRMAGEDTAEAGVYGNIIEGGDADGNHSVNETEFAGLLSEATGFNVTPGDDHSSEVFAAWDILDGTTGNLVPVDVQGTDGNTYNIAEGEDGNYYHPTTGVKIEQGGEGVPTDIPGWNVAITGDVRQLADAMGITPAEMQQMMWSSDQTHGNNDGMVTSGEMFRMLDTNNNRSISGRDYFGGSLLNQLGIGFEGGKLSFSAPTHVSIEGVGDTPGPVESLSGLSIWAPDGTVHAADSPQVTPQVETPTQPATP